MGASMAAHGYKPLGAAHTKSEDARPARNIYSAALWAVLYIVSIVGCFYSFANINPEIINLINPGFLNNAANCPPEGHRNLLSSGIAVSFPSQSLPTDAELGTHAAAWMSASLLVSIAMAVGLMHLLRTCAHHVIMATVFVSLSIPTFFSMSNLLSGKPTSMAMAAVTGGATALGFLLLRWSKREIKAASSVLATSVHALTVNPSLIMHITIVSFVGMFACAPPFMWLLTSLANGKFVPNPVRQGTNACVDADGAPITCCFWEVDSSVVSIMLGFPVAIWSAALVNQIRVFMISGAVAQWFFAPHGPTAGHAARSLAHGMWSSLGTNVAIAGIMAVFSTLQSMSQIPLISFLGSGMAIVAFFFAMFVTSTAAITGEGLLAAGSRTWTLLARNIWSTLAVVVSIPVTVLTLISVAFSSVMGGAVYAAYQYDHLSAGQLSPVVLGVFVASIVMTIMAFLITVIHNVADALVMAFMIEQNDASWTNEEMCTVLAGVMAEKAGGPPAKGWAPPLIADSLEEGNMAKLLP